MKGKDELFTLSMQELEFLLCKCICPAILGFETEYSLTSECGGCDSCCNVNDCWNSEVAKILNRDFINLDDSDLELTGIEVVHKHLSPNLIVSVLCHELCPENFNIRMKYSINTPLCHESLIGDCDECWESDIVEVLPDK